MSSTACGFVGGEQDRRRNARLRVCRNTEDDAVRSVAGDASSPNSRRSRCEAPLRVGAADSGSVRSFRHQAPGLRPKAALGALWIVDWRKCTRWHINTPSSLASCIISTDTRRFLGKRASVAIHDLSTKGTCVVHKMWTAKFFRAQSLCLPVARQRG